MRHTPKALSLALAAATLPAQMSGGYLIDPNTPSAFPSFTAAVNALFVNGVNGPVDILVAPGSYTESVLVPPIPGTSSTNTVTFRTVAGPGTVLLQGSLGDIFAMLAVAFAPLGWVTFDGLDFTGAPGHAISATRFVEDIEVRNCTFTAGHVSTAPGEFRHAVIVSESNERWNVHHNHITLSPHTNRTSYGIYESNGGQWDVHHNTFDLNGADYGLYMINSNRVPDRVYDNLFVGSLYATTSSSHTSVAAIKADVSNYDNWFVHNTFALTITTNGCCIASSGLTGNPPAQNYIYGNIFMILGTGTAIVTSETSGVPRPFESDGNVFFCPGGSVGRVGPSSSGIAYPTLASWQAATGKDAASLETDPLLVNPFATPPDLRPTPASPITGVAVNTPVYVTDDFAGRLRDAQPDAGAYESTSFALYGAGCPGTGAVVPALGSAGTVALGSTNFSFELTQAAPSALCAMLGGFSRTISTLGPLPYPIGGGCEILAAPDTASTLLTSGLGTASVPYSIPSSAGLSGVDLFFQWVVVDPQSGSGFGVAVSEGGALQL